jgi:type I restriction-modification system DNA methylase subunit
MTRSAQIKLNQEITALVQRKVVSGEPWTPAEIQVAQQYSGDGGLVKTTRGALYEFYTPDEIVSRMWALAYKFGFKSGNILEPSVGIGRFLHYVDPTNCYVDAFEFSKDNDTSYQIAKATYPWANIRCDYFESIWYDGNKRINTAERYDLVIGNPPYNEFTGRYAAKNLEGSWFPGFTYDQYFIWAGIELLKSGGLLVMIIPSGLLSTGNKYEAFKDVIYAKADLMAAYRLPEKVFDYTQYQTDIVVFKKR